MCVFTVTIFPREIFSAFCLISVLLLKFPLWYFQLLGGAQFNIFHPGVAALDEDPRKRVKLCIGLGVNWQLIGVEMLHEGFIFVAAKRFRSVLSLQAGFKTIKICVVLDLDCPKHIDFFLLVCAGRKCSSSSPTPVG